MEQQGTSQTSFDPCIITRFLERTRAFLDIEHVDEKPKTKEEMEDEKGKRIVWWARAALKQRNLKVAETACRTLQNAIDAGGYGDTAYLKRELKKIRNGIDCVRALEEETTA